MKIIADENITFAEEAFSLVGNVTLLPGNQISRECILNADALIVRSVTRVDKKLLENSSVRFVGTATIGTDHIDIDYLNEKGIVFSDAKGCNKYAVAEYILSVLSDICTRRNVSLTDKSMGIIGWGNIGKIVELYASLLGMKTIVNDPPLEEGDRESNRVTERQSDKERNDECISFHSLEEALGCDFVTFHCPLNKSGRFKSYHLLNENNIDLLKSGCFLINAARGAVISSVALKQRLLKQKDVFFYADVWENEPYIDKELLDVAEIGTAHIAGYTLEGKINGTKIIYEKLCDFTGKAATWQPFLPEVKDSVINLSGINSLQEAVIRICGKAGSLRQDDSLLRNSFNRGVNSSECFTGLRKNYLHRREFNSYSVNNVNPDLIEVLREFRIIL